MTAKEQLEYWKDKFTSLDVYKKYEHEIEVIDQQELIVYRFVKDRDKDNITCFKIDCYGDFEHEFSVWKIHALEEDAYFPLSEEGFEKPVAHFKKRL